MNSGKTRFSTNLKSQNLRALRQLALNNGCHKCGEIINEALELYLQKNMTQVTLWLPIDYATFLDEYADRTLEEIVAQPLASEVKATFSNGKIDEKAAEKIVQALGFTLWEL
jgi:hypothetical protein